MEKTTVPQTEDDLYDGLAKSRAEALASSLAIQKKQVLISNGNDDIPTWGDPLFPSSSLDEWAINNAIEVLLQHEAIVEKPEEIKEIKEVEEEGWTCD